MAEHRIEADRDRIPVRVYHDYSREVWTHPWLEECELCERTPRYDMDNRKAVLHSAMVELRKAKEASDEA